MSKIKNGGLDQYGAEPFEQRPAGIEEVKRQSCFSKRNPTLKIF